ncbi:MAG TPA: DmsC/YnfH family molybdoenzyme membrane anchor subunit [Hyphomicrobiaceae bacterium]|nr:DmsC/YnfH family molybdoenzyme membrane anchor subunit [Hyphomicrobiaceae bacterium]
MHPAYSVIVFTTASGAGLGLIAWLALLGAAGAVPTERWLGLGGFALGFLLLGGGLLVSTAHLGRPERAWRAFSQWRTSWLSREGVMAVATCVPAALTAIGWVFLERADGFFALMAWLTAVCAVLTLLTTGMIYASLSTVRQWRQPLTMPIYIALGLASGALLLHLLLVLFGWRMTWPAWLAGACLAISAILKWAYWLRIDGEAREHTIETATGLGRLGKVRALEPPHTEPNYIMREMGYSVARKHALKLRRLALALAFWLPILLVLLSQAPGLAVPASLLAVASTTAGLLVERWLFFAEAEHVAMLYYGAEAA